MTARLLRPFNINVAHKPTHKLRSYFTKHKDKTTTTETKNAIYMILCRDCPQRYIGQTSKKIETRITEHYLQHTRTTAVIPLTGQKLNYWDEHRTNTHANLKRHGTVQTVI